MLGKTWLIQNYINSIPLIVYIFLETFSEMEKLIPFAPLITPLLDLIPKAMDPNALMAMMEKKNEQNTKNMMEFMKMMQNQNATSTNTVCY